MRPRLLIWVLTLALGAAACSTAPDGQSPYVARLCYVNRDERTWVQIAPPQNAQAYRDAWPQGANGDPYPTYRWPKDEFWFRSTAGATRLCVGNPFYREERCSAGYTMDYTESADGLTTLDYNEAICIV